MTYKPPEISEEARKMATKFFEHAVATAETRAYDYAIELYLQGLAKDPRAVEKGHQALRELSLRRKMAGGKKAGMFESLKRGGSPIKKDVYQTLLNAEFLLAKDPFNVAHAETLVKGVDAAELPEVLGWALNVLLELCRQEKKPNPQRLLLIFQLSEKLGDYYDQSATPDRAIGYYQLALTALDFGLLAGVGQNLDFQSLQRDLAGKLTILRGKYGAASSFRDSIHNAGAQQELMDQERSVKSEDLMETMIVRARDALKANPDVAGKINALADLLLQRGRDEDEAEAIAMLQGAFDRTRQYAYKLRADDVRIRQMNRAIKGLREKLGAGEDADLRSRLEQAQRELDEFELTVFEERVKEYPTDTKIKYELGRRFHRLKRYDEAIPVFQEAVADPRHSIHAKHYIGTCFYQKGWFQQAIDVETEAIARHPTAGDTLSKDMHYILARSYENAGQKDLALKTFSKLIQWDFNFRDVRQRIDKLQKSS